MNQHYDIVIVGGGLVGAALAIALKNTRYRVAVLESNPPIKTIADSGSGLNQRAIVLSKASQNILSTLGLWPQVVPFATEVRDIHVSNKGHFGAVRIGAAEQNVDALGYVVSAENLYCQLQAALTSIDVFYGAAFQSMTREQDRATVRFDCQGEQAITADLVVGADGSRSTLREQQSIPCQRHDYQQSVILCNVSLSHDHHYVAYERFTKTGPCALLPMAKKTSAVVWAATPDQATKLTELSEVDFLKTLQAHFGYRCGKFLAASAPVAFPLSLVQIKDCVKPNLVFVGNASQTLHPIAGQGLNLGLRDMALLAEMLSETAEPIGSLSFLASYGARRKADQKQTIQLTHGLVTLFSHDFRPLSAATTAGMLLMERTPALRRRFAQSAMGLLGDLPKLACGVPL